MCDFMSLIEILASIDDFGVFDFKNPPLNGGDQEIEVQMACNSCVWLKITPWSFDLLSIDQTDSFVSDWFMVYHSSLT